MKLTAKKCVPCEGGTLPLTTEQVQPLLEQVSGWQVVEEKKITKQFGFKDFKEAMLFVTAVSRIAESEGHHPDIAIHYNKVDLVLWTHAIGGLSENDFILAAKINEIRLDPSHISIDDLVKVEIKMGTIRSAEKVEGADKLLKFSVDFSNETRTIVSGVAEYYAPEVMVGKQVPVITNLAPRNIKGVESNGMIVYAIEQSEVDGERKKKTVMLNPEQPVPPGSLVQ